MKCEGMTRYISLSQMTFNGNGIFEAEKISPSKVVIFNKLCLLSSVLPLLGLLDNKYVVINF